MSARSNSPSKAVPVSTARRPTRTGAALLSLVSLVVGSCGGTDVVAVPGVADPATPTGPVAASAPAFVPVDAAPTSSPVVTHDAGPVSTVASETVLDTIARPESTGISTGLSTGSSAGNAAGAVVLPQVSGWPAFDLHLQTLLAGGSSAVSATVLRDGEIVHEVAMGNRLLDGSDPVTIGDRYRVASISKVITAITMLQLVEAGLIDLDAPVGERLAARVGVTATSDVARITLRQLLTHRSGIGQYEDLMFRRQVESCPAAGAMALGRGLERLPGTTFRYSNVNFCLLGELIEDVTGERYVDVVARELLTPLGLDGMRLAGTFDLGDGDVEHDSDAGRNYMEVLDGAGSWIASSTDVAVIIDSLDLTTPGWKPLGPAALGAMTTITVDPEPPATSPGESPGATSSVPPPTVVPVPPTSGYGMGLMIFGPGSYGHTGTLESTSAMTVRRPDGITWAITVSGDEPGSGRDLFAVIDAAFRYAGVLDP
ncbi:MAG: serine hydrolase domain-containing protein [Ilumatobacter sp.]|uniref:serine hydrolase domain-containing protein n=1 Tax=Ilumatobacter sp. TaxID=1967498 RepID=UPI00391A0E42